MLSSCADKGVLGAEIRLRLFQPRLIPTTVTSSEYEKGLGLSGGYDETLIEIGL